MVISMTGYGRGEYLGDSYNINIELKAVNHRYNDIKIHMPRYMYFLEEDMKKMIRGKMQRGRVDVYVNMEYIDDSTFDIDVNLPLAREYNKALNLITDELNLESEVDLDNITSIPDMINIERRVMEDDELWLALKDALNMALEEALSMKKSEGKSLKYDMIERLDLMEDKIGLLEKHVPDIVREYKNNLEERLGEILEEIEVDEYILANELANYADKSDVTEELTRLKSHVSQYRNILEEEEPIGRKLDFLIQEINREINTIGSKSGDIKIVREVVEIKSIIEKLREQVQNIE